MCIGKNDSCKEVGGLSTTVDGNLISRVTLNIIALKQLKNLSALLKISLHIDTDKKILVYKSMIISQFTLL